MFGTGALLPPIARPDSYIAIQKIHVVINSIIQADDDVELISSKIERCASICNTGSTLMPEGAPGPAIGALDWAKLAVDLYNSPNTAQLAHYIAAQIDAAGAQFNFYQDTRFTVPRGSTLRFWMANVDDSVTLRCFGLVESLGAGQSNQWLFPVQAPGPGLIIAELGNGGGYNTSLSLHVGISTGPNTDRRFVQMDFKDSDPPLTQHKRNFIFRFAIG